MIAAGCHGAVPDRASPRAADGRDSIDRLSDVHGSAASSCPHLMRRNTIDPKEGTMKPVLATLTAIAIAATVFGSSRLLATPASAAAVAKQQSGFKLLPPAAPAGQMTLYGHVKTLTRRGGRFEMQFDPAWFTTGVTASRGALQNTGSSDVPNDNYVVEEGHRLLTYLVPTSARITVLTNNGQGIAATPINVSELSRIVSGGKHRRLFEPLDSGVWIRVHVDTVRSVDQQYRP